MIRFLVTRNGSVGQETIAFAFYAHEAEDFSPFSFSIFSFSSHNVSHSFKIYETVLSEKNTFIISLHQRIHGRYEHEDEDYVKKASDR